MGDNLSLADVMALTKDGGGLNNGGGLIFILFILMLFGGFGGNGWGNNGTGGNFTNSQIEDGFRQNAVINKLDNLTTGLCDTTYALANNMSNGFNSLERTISSCCCDTNRNIDSVKYEMSKGFCDVINANSMNTRDIIESQNRGTQRIIDTMQANLVQNLRDELSTIKTVASQENQSRYILGELGRYVTNPPCPPPFYYGNYAC